MNILIIAINDPTDGVLISTARHEVAQEIIDAAKAKKNSLITCNIEFGMKILFSDGTSAVWNNLQHSDCLK